MQQKLLFYIAPGAAEKGLLKGSSKQQENNNNNMMYLDLALLHTLF